MQATTRRFDPGKHRNGRDRPASGGAVEGGGDRNGRSWSFTVRRAPPPHGQAQARHGEQGTRGVVAPSEAAATPSPPFVRPFPFSFPFASLAFLLPTPLSTPFQRNGLAPLYRPPPAPHRHRLAPSRPPILSRPSHRSGSQRNRSIRP